VSVGQIVLLIVAVYGAVGAVFALVYVLRLAPGRDTALRASGKSVRLLLLPGAAAVWPLLIRPWRTEGDA